MTTPFAHGAGLRRGLPSTGGIQFVMPGPGGSQQAVDRRTADEVGGALGVLVAGLRFDSDAKGRTRHDSYTRGLELTERAVSENLAQIRNDSGFSAGLGGGANPRDLVHRMRRVMEQKLPPLQAKKVFPVNTEVPPGAAEYEQHRTYHTGEAVAYRGQKGEAIPGVGVGAASFKAPVVAAITKVSINWLEVLRSNFAGLNVEARKMAAGRRVMEEFVDRRAWLGDSDLGLYGVYNHPYVDTIAATSDLGPTGGTSADDLSAELIELANRSRELSRGAYEPDTMAIASKLYNDIASKRFGSGSDTTVLDHFKKSCPHIKNIEVVYRLDDIAGDGLHGIFFCKGRGADGASAELVVPMATTLLPADSRALTTNMYLVQLYGGVLQNQVGDNLFVIMAGR